MRCCSLVLLLALSAMAPLRAGELVVVVDGGHGPVADAVVSVRREGGNLAAPQHAPSTKTIDQRDETFIPYVEIFRPGDRVIFRNSDTTRHHVYSFAPAKTFEFVIAPGQSAAPIVLDRVGEIAVGCNIHDQMITHLYISDAPWIARTGVDGRVVFEDMPPGDYSVQVWHPQLRSGSAQRKLALGDADASIAFTLKLLPDPREAAGDRERSRY